MRSKLHHRWYVPYLFLLPGLALYVLWMVYPLGYELYISFFDWKIMPGQQSDYVALDNYREVLEDKYFWLALKNTARYTAITVVGQMIIGLALAVLVHRVFIGKRVFRAIYYVPVITSWVVVSFLFQFLFSSDRGGFVNYMLVSVFGLMDGPVGWMSETRTAWIIIYALGIWKGVGWTMVIFLAALQGVPVELYEVAAIDGAGEWRQFRHVTVPLIRRTTQFIMLALIIDGFQA
ncbi:MAG: sugar ABC transporter permease, partial [Chloroflexi bacterium]